MIQDTKKEQDKQTKRFRIDLLSILRYGILILLIIYIAFLFTGMGDNNTPFSKVDKAVRAVIDTGKLKEGSARDYKKRYQLNAEDFADTMLYYAEGTMEVEELLIIKVKDDSQIAAVEKAVENRLSAQKDSFKGYGVSQTKLLNSAIVETKGSYVFFVVSEDAQKYQDAFLKTL